MNTEKIKLPLSAVTGLLFSRLGYAWELVVFVLAAILLDYVTGMLAGRTNEGLSSKRAVKGLYKKVGLFSLLCLGFLLDTSLNNYIEKGIGFPLPINLPVGLIVSAWIVITEAISICENLDKLGIPIPSWLLGLLSKSKKTIDDTTENTTEDTTENSKNTNEEEKK